jgi:Raf kinase inhibitor-like YbhB/YbcL family protein
MLDHLGGLMLSLHSESFADGAEIPRRSGKKDQNVSPELSWDDPPDGTESYALAMVDRDAEADNYVHWLVVDISPFTTELPEDAANGAMPAGASEVNPYAGPFPPSGAHDYEFMLYALSTPHVEVPSKPTLDQFVEAIEPYTLETASLFGIFTR